jgi:hypothetical protein
MAVPLGALLVGPTAATTEFEEGVDGGAPRGCYHQVRQWPPPRLKKTSMAGCLGALLTDPADVGAGRCRGWSTGGGGSHPSGGSCGARADVLSQPRPLGLPRVSGARTR